MKEGGQSADKNVGDSAAGLISLAFGVPADNFYGKGGFVIFWMSNFL